MIAEAGVSIGTFYKYFESREDLAQSLWADPVERLKTNLQARFELAKNPSEQVRVLLKGYVNFALENRRVFRGAFLFVRPDTRPAPEQISLEDEMFYQNLCKAFTEGQRDGSFNTFDSGAMAQVFWAAIHGALALPINLDRYEFDEPDTLSSNMIESLMDLIAAKPFVEDKR